MQVPSQVIKGGRSQSPWGMVGTDGSQNNLSGLKVIPRDMALGAMGHSTSSRPPGPTDGRAECSNTCVHGPHPESHSRETQGASKDLSQSRARVRRPRSLGQSLNAQERRVVFTVEICFQKSKEEYCVARESYMKTKLSGSAKKMHPCHAHSFTYHPRLLSHSSGRAE